MEAGEREPRFVPKEYEVGLDRETFLHDANRIVDDAVERAVGERDQLDPVSYTHLTLPTM